jgi:hypothetical protein
MDVRFCRVQEPTAERRTCAAINPDQAHNALSRARTEDSCFSVDKDLHGCRLTSRYEDWGSEKAGTSGRSICSSSLPGSLD